MNWFFTTSSGQNSKQSKTFVDSFLTSIDVSKFETLARGNLTIFEILLYIKNSHPKNIVILIRLANNFLIIMTNYGKNGLWALKISSTVQSRESSFYGDYYLTAKDYLDNNNSLGHYLLKILALQTFSDRSCLL